MRMFEVMTEGVATVKPTAAAADAWELMRRKSIHHLVVVQGSQILGILSDRDVGGRAGASIRAGHTVADLMTKSGCDKSADRHHSFRRQPDARTNHRVRARRRSRSSGGHRDGVGPPAATRTRC